MRLPLRYVGYGAVGFDVVGLGVDSRFRFSPLCPAALRKARLW